MPSPSTIQATLRPDIAAAFMEFDAEIDSLGYIGPKVLPVFDVTEQHGVYPVIPIEQLLKNPETRRTNHAGYNLLDWTFTNASYACEEHGLKSPVDDRAARMYRNFFDAEVMTVANLRAAVMRAAEKRYAATLFNATTFSGQVTSITNEWDANHTANAIPVDDVKTATFAVYDRTGVWPNALVISRKVFKNLKNLDQIKEAIASSGAGDPNKQADITAQMLAQVFDLDMVLVAGGSKNSANEGQTATIAEIWDDEYALVARVATTNNFAEPCLGRTLHWAEDGSIIGGTIDQYRDEDKRADIYRVRHDVDEKLLYTACGQLLDNVTT